MHSVKTRRWMSYQGVSLGINLQGLYSIIIVCIHILILHAHPDVLGSDLSSGKKGVGCFASALSKERKGCPGASWGEADILGGHPLPFPGNVSFLLWHPSCLLHVVRQRLVQIWNQLFSLKDNLHPSSWSVSAGRRCFSREKIPNGVLYTKILDTLHIWATIHKGHAFYITTRLSFKPSYITFLQRYNPRILHNL